MPHLLLKEVRCDENKMLIFYLDVVLFLLLLSVIEAVVLAITPLGIVEPYGRGYCYYFFSSKKRSCNPKGTIFKTTTL